MGQRISRAKQTIRAAGGRFERPPEHERAGRLQVVLQVLYLIFNEGYTATSGPDLQRPDLTAEAIRLARDVHRMMPVDPEVSGLLALMLLTDARRPARTRADGSLVPLDRQDRGRWNRAMIDEGTALITAALARGPAGPYQLQAAIAAIHDEARARRGHGLGPDPRAVRDARGGRPEPDGDPQPGRRRGNGARPAAGSSCSPRSRRTRGWPATTGSHAVRAHLLERSGDRAARSPNTATAARLPAVCPNAATSRSRPRDSSD